MRDTTTTDIVVDRAGPGLISGYNHLFVFPFFYIIQLLLSFIIDCRHTALAQAFALVIVLLYHQHTISIFEEGWRAVSSESSSSLGFVYFWRMYMICVCFGWHVRRFKRRKIIHKWKSTFVRFFFSISFTQHTREWRDDNNWWRWWEGGERERWKIEIVQLRAPCTTHSMRMRNAFIALSLVFLNLPTLEIWREIDDWNFIRQWAVCHGRGIMINSFSQL